MYARGNALFLILIAVALFAALSYAITQSSRGGGSITKEQEMLDTAVSQQCSAYVDRGKMMLKIVGGCSSAEISYELPDGGNENENNPDNTSCFLFHEDGAGLSPCGAYAEVEESGVETGMIAYGDTETVALLSDGTYFKCDAFTAQYSFSGFCRGWSYSFDGTTFLNSPVCFGKDGDEASGRFPDMMETFGSEVCMAACGDGNYPAYVDAETMSSPVTAYLAPDMSLVPYTGACEGILDPADAVECSCWSE